jgi:thioredoxin 1
MNDSKTLAGRVTPVGADTFTDVVVRGPGQIVVEFMSYGCEHCRAMEPVLQEVAAQSTMRFFNVDIDANEDLASMYEISATPTFIMFSGGKEVGRVEGPQPVASTLSALLAQSFEA